MTRAGPSGIRPRRLAAATVAAYGFDHLVASASPPVRAVQEIRPVAVTTPMPGRRFSTLGQNVTGTCLSNLGPAGTTVVLTHAEALGPDGT